MKLKRRLQAFLIALVMVFGMLVPGVTVYADPTAEGTVSFLSAPAEIGWADGVEANILQFKAVEGATGYEIGLSVPSKNFQDYCLFVPKSGYDRYEYDIKSQMENEEAMWNADLSGKLTVSVYAFSGDWHAIDIQSFNNADHRDIITSAFVSYVGNMAATPTPEGVNLNLSEDNKLTVSFNKVLDGDGKVPSEFNLLFLDGDNNPVKETRCYESYRSGERSDQLIWSLSADSNSIEIPVPDDFRQIYLSDISSLSVKVSARSDARYAEGGLKGKLKYKVSEWSASAEPITNSKATVIDVGSVNTDEFNSQEGKKLSITEEDAVQKLLPKAETGTSITVEVKKNENSSSFTDVQSSKAYTGLVTFEVNLYKHTAADEKGKSGIEVHETNHAVLITVPIPDSLKGRKVIILTKHSDEATRKIGSKISDDGTTISFYANKFSDYAIAGKTEGIITFYANDGSADNSAQTVTLGTATALSPNSFTRNGYTFTGWNTSADGSGTSYTDGQSVTLTNDLTLYARWKADATPSSSGGGSAAPIVDRTTATNTVSDATVSAKSTVSDSVLSTAAKDLAVSLIDQAKTDADKKISSAASTNTANTAAADAEAAIKEITARVEKAEAITDITGSGDQKDAVQYGIVKGYIQGTSDTTFSPNGNVTRAQFVTFLYRLAGSPAVSGTLEFNDVKDNANLGGGDFAAAIQWASKVGIAKGFSDGSFKPGETVTREQSVAFLHRYFTNISGGVDNAFADVKDGAWYDQDIRWGVGSGVVKGISATEFGVGNNTTRAQAAQFIYRAAVK